MVVVVVFVVLGWVVLVEFDVFVLLSVTRRFVVVVVFLPLFDPSFDEIDDADDESDSLASDDEVDDEDEDDDDDDDDEPVNETELGVADPNDDEDDGDEAADDDDVLSRLGSSFLDAVVVVVFVVDRDGFESPWTSGRRARLLGVVVVGFLTFVVE